MCVERVGGLSSTGPIGPLVHQFIASTYDYYQDVEERSSEGHARVVIRQPVPLSETEPYPVPLSETEP